MLANKKQICIIIGASHAGVNAAFNLRKEGWLGNIILYDVDVNIPYHRPPLSKSYILDTTLKSNFLKPLDSYTSEGITLQLGKKVTSINRLEKSVSIKGEKNQTYDKLILATGAKPYIPKIKGLKEATQVFAMRTLADASNIKMAINASEKKRVVIIGGGYIGLETAASLKKMGANVTVLEREKRILARVTAPVTSSFFKTLHQQNKVNIITEKNVTAIENTNNINKILCDDKTSFKADIIIIGVGIIVNTKLAASANLEIENGIKVNEFAQTTDHNIYAVGDCTYHYNPHYKSFNRLESVQNAVDQSKIAAASICGKNTIYNTIPWFWSDQFNIKLQIVGLSNGYNNVHVRKENNALKSFSVWYFKDDELLAVDAINNGKAFVLASRFIKDHKKINKAKLVDVSIPLKPTSFLY